MSLREIDAEDLGVSVTVLKWDYGKIQK
jgi:hypothetical protein